MEPTRAAFAVFAAPPALMEVGAALAAAEEAPFVLLLLLLPLAAVAPTFASIKSPAAGSKPCWHTLNIKSR